MNYDLASKIMITPHWNRLNEYCWILDSSLQYKSPSFVPAETIRMSRFNFVFIRWLLYPLTHTDIKCDTIAASAVSILLNSLAKL
jgi:hypothetical protein